MTMASIRRRRREQEEEESQYPVGRGARRRRTTTFGVVLALSSLPVLSRGLVPYTQPPRARRCTEPTLRPHLLNRQAPVCSAAHAASPSERDEATAGVVGTTPRPEAIVDGNAASPPEETEATTTTTTEEDDEASQKEEAEAPPPSSTTSTSVIIPKKKKKMITLSRAITDPFGKPEEEEDDGSALLPPPPLCVTFEPIDVLVRRSVPFGLVYRDTLLRWTGIRLPRPSFFDAALRDALRRNAVTSPRFGGELKEPLEEFWRRVTRETFDAILTPDVYDEEERKKYDYRFESVFQELYDLVLVSDEVWEPAPDVARILSALREWRDERGGPRIGIVSTAHDHRLTRMLAAVLGEDECAETFDFVVAASHDEGAPFELAGAARGLDVDPERCVHIMPGDSMDLNLPDCPVQVVASAKTDLNSEAHATLIDLLDIFQLPKIPEDDLIITTRLYANNDDDTIY